MTLRRRMLKTITWVLIFSFVASASPVQAEETELNRVKVIQATKKINEVVVERGLPWSEGGLKGARAILDNQKSTIEVAMERLRRIGATKIEVVNLRDDFTEPRWLNKAQYGANFSTWRMLGRTSLGKEAGKSSVFPRDQAILANYLTRIEPGTCALVDFSIFQPQTWFLPKKCQIAIAKPEQFLRAALATNLQKITWDVGYWEIGALEFALSEGTNLRVKDGYLYCPELSKLSPGQNRILLDLADPLGG